MNTLNTLTSALIAFGVLVSPFAAEAEVRPAPEETAPDTFPMKADAFKKVADRKLELLKTHAERGIAKRSLLPEQKTAVERALDGGIKDLRAAIDRVAADGIVTREEAKQVKDLAAQFRAKLRDQLRGRHARAKAGKARRTGEKPRTRESP
jgi:hypothetical protein